MLFTADGIAEQGGASAWKQIVGKIKEDVCFVSLDLAADKEKTGQSPELSKNYILPEGQSVTVNTRRFLAPEAFFNLGIIKKGDEAPRYASNVAQICSRV